MTYHDQPAERPTPVSTFVLIGLVFVIIAGGGVSTCMWGMPQYGVYSRKMKGEAAYEQATQDRRIMVLEAQAHLDSAKLNAQAEIARAQGTNTSNEIMARSLGGPDNYLRWSYIHMLEETAGKGDRQVIYLPTEAGMPILEAGRAAK